MIRRTYFARLAGSALASLLLFSCGNAPKLTLTASDETLISGCVITVRARDAGRADETSKIDWYVDGVKVPDAVHGDLDLTREVSEPTAITVAAKPSGRIGAKKTTIAIRAAPVPFKNPLASDYEFTKDPVIARGNDVFVDPGAIAYGEGKFYASLNAIRREPELHSSYAESADGVTWTRSDEPEKDTLSIGLVAKAIGVRPNNVHSGSLILDRGEWTLYFTATNAGDYFYGNVFRATAAQPNGPWKIDAAPVLGALGNDWYKGDQGLPQIFKVSDTEYRLYYATRKGAVALARSSDGIHFVKDDKPVAYALLPTIAKTDWGWVMISNDTIYLSLDGISWQRYAQKLFSAKDLEDRESITPMVTALLVHGGEFRYYLEGMTKTNSNVFLISWAE